MREREEEEEDEEGRTEAEGEKAKGGKIKFIGFKSLFQILSRCEMQRCCLCKVAQFSRTGSGTGTASSLRFIFKIQTPFLDQTLNSTILSR